MRRKAFYGIGIAKNDKNSLYGQKNAVFDDVIKSIIALGCVFLSFLILQEAYTILVQ